MNEPTLTPVHAIGDEEPKPLEGAAWADPDGPDAWKHQRIWISDVEYVRAQTRQESFKESLQNIVWGFTLSLAINALYLAFLLTGDVWFDAMVIAVIMTIVSLLRSYTIRRYNNWRQGR